MKLQDIQLIILAGGLGTRLADTIGNRPKILAPIGNTTFFDIQLNWLKKQGARNIMFSLGHKSEQIIQKIRDEDYSDVELSYKVEPTSLGTAGALNFCLQEMTCDFVLVLNGDSFVDVNLEDFIKQSVNYFSNNGVIGSLVSARTDNSARYGGLIVDANNLLIKFQEKSENKNVGLINAGIYFLKRELLTKISNSNAKSLEFDVLQKLPPRSIFVYDGDYKFIDIGTPKSLAQSTDFFFDSNLIK